MEEDFQILLEYKRSKAVAAAAEPPKQVCLHVDQVEHEGFHVCTQCGLVLDRVFQPEVNWTSRCVIAKSYSPSDSLQAVDKHLIAFMEKTGIRAPLHPIQERLRFMKMQSGYKSLNYAIALACILQEDIDAQESLVPYLPQSNVAWARSSRLLKPLPRHFITLWLRNLLKKPKPLSKAQERKHQENLALFQPEQHDLMHDMTRCYDGSPTLLKCALYRFSQAILK